MTAYILIREDQNDHGFIDTSIIGLFRSREKAETRFETCLAEARDANLRVHGDVDADWQVYWRIETHQVEGSNSHQHRSTAESA